ncbi:phospholipase D family protein [Luteitalea sp.]|uniref:phospholipase D family protein n=1 Tax=Luteitalea sp. TaxID=2004800 RepID=UPI0025C2B4B0|nr:phospholipase D family protein [Luteitalea sp.]
MLNPEARTLLFDILRPPEGYILDAAVATTYTLDLLALLTAPVAFSLFEADDFATLLSRDSLALLDSLRRYADRLTVFCEAGQIAFPALQFPQLAYLEQAVVQCRKPRPGASFHPKVWVLRYTSAEGPVRYRFACLSRNLTFDRSWDTVLTLDGVLGDATNDRNSPLVRFLRALPSQATATVEPAVADRLDLLATELARVTFDVPEGFEDLRFHPLGIEGMRTFPVPADSQPLLVISPFVSTSGIRRLARGRSRVTLITRQETLDTVDCSAPEIAKYYVLASNTSPVEGDEDTTAVARGLHAKCYVTEAGAKARVYTGSANATEAGLGHNVEFLVELIGPRARFGIDAVLSSQPGNTRFVDVLQEVTLPPLAACDEVEEGLRSALEQARDLVAEASLRGMLTEHEPTYTLEVLSAAPLKWPAAVTARCWPVGLGRAWARAFTDSTSVTFEGLALENVSGFLAFEVRAALDQKECVETFVVNVPIAGLPTDRRERLLRTVLTDRRSVMHYLHMLLATDGRELASELAASETHRRSEAGRMVPVRETALLESLLRSLRESPARLDDVERLVRDLGSRSTTDGDLLPENFLELWAPLWQARKEMATWQS